MKGRGLVMVLGFFLLGGRCSDTPTRPPAPPSGWILPLVAPDSSEGLLILSDVIFGSPDLILMGFLFDASRSSVRNFVGRLTWSGTWVAFHPLSHGQGDLFLTPVKGKHDLIAGYPLTIASPCQAFLFNLDGTVRHTLTVDPQAYGCAILDVLSQASGFLVAGVTAGLQDTLYTFLAFLEATPEGYRPTWLRHYQRSSHPFNLGGILVPLSEGVGLIGITSDNTTWSDGDSLWLLKLTSSGGVVAETTLASPYLHQIAAWGDTVAVLSRDLDTSALLAWDFKSFRVLWSQKDSPYRLVDALPTSPLLGAIAADSGAPQYVQLSLRTGEKTTSRELWASVWHFDLLRTGPLGFLTTFWEWETQSSYLAYIPYGGELPPLPDSAASGAGRQVFCSPVSRLVYFLEKRAQGNPGMVVCRELR